MGEVGWVRWGGGGGVGEVRWGEVGWGRWGGVEMATSEVWER